jgi:hypothetical protein
VTLATKPLALFALALAFACSGPKQEPAPKTVVASVPAKAVQPPAEPPAPAVKEAPPVSAATLPPRKVVEGDGITITETADGSVILKTTSLWNESFDTTYQTCDYYRGAVPVLKHQLRKDRAKLLDQACIKDKKKTAGPAAPPPR